LPAVPSVSLGHGGPRKSTNGEAERKCDVGAPVGRATSKSSTAPLIRSKRNEVESTGGELKHFGRAHSDSELRDYHPTSATK